MCPFYHLVKRVVKLRNPQERPEGFLPTVIGASMRGRGGGEFYPSH